MPETTVEKVLVSDAEIEKKIREEYEGKFAVWKTKELAELEAQQDVQIQDAVLKYVEEWKEKQKPPSKDEIQLLLSQEYVDFELLIKYADPTDDEPSRMAQKPFTIRELPQDVEKKFYQMFRKHLTEHLPELNAFMQKNLDKSFEEKANSFMEAFEGSFDILAETVVLVLNPYNKISWLTLEWVQSHISSMRQWNIVQAQIDANKLRDFFSKLSQSGQTIQTMTEPLNFQQLRQRVP